MSTNGATNNQLLVLSGGGDFAGIPRLNSSVQGIFRDLPESRLLIIPFAADEDDHDDIMEYVESSVGVGFDAIDIMTTPEEIEDLDLSQYSLIYLEGGNTFDLLQTIRSSPLMTELVRYYKEGGALFGDSAGAIVLGANADTAFFGDESDENYTSLQQFGGLNLLGSWSIHCHYKTADDDQCQDFVYSSGTQIVAIPEDSTLMIEKDGTSTVFGTLPIVVFSFAGKSRYLPGQQFNLLQI